MVLPLSRRVRPVRQNPFAHFLMVALRQDVTPQKSLSVLIDMTRIFAPFFPHYGKYLRPFPAQVFQDQLLAI